MKRALLSEGMSGDSDQQHHLTRVLRCKGDRVEGLFLGEKIVACSVFHPDGLAVRECYRLPLRRDHLEIPHVAWAFKGRSI